MKHVILGNGIAGVSAAKRIREKDPRAHIDIITRESHAFYARPMLPRFVSGEIGEQDLIIYAPEWYLQKNISLVLNEEITDVDLKAHVAKSAGGHAYSFDRLLIATGSKCFIPPFKGADLAGVFTLHSIGDARRIKERARNCRSAVIIGCGVLGLELAAALTKFGIQVSLIESAPRMLPRQLDNAGANVLKNLLEEKHGLAFYLDSQVQEIAGAGRAEGVVLAGGGCVQGDIVVISAGVRPNVGLAERMGLKVNKGIIVDDRMETSQQDVFAAGDVAQHRGIVYGIVPAAQRQGEVAGANMAGGSESYEGTTISNFVNVLGTSLVSAGEIDAAGNRPSLVRMDEVKNSYRKLVFENGMITGSILLNDVRGSAEILQAIQKKINVGPLRESLLDDNFDYQRLVHAQI
ncbi:MAG: NAD(P)/FAD-dependent oxidoreductase [Chloroflexi bacterium]|nr:NAD(P)/FAD-dependent oxidoreductase [Chloroflexota bacterium]